MFLVKGNVRISKAGLDESPAKQNTFLDNNHLIKIGRNAEITLANKDQEFYVLKTPGIYKLSSLEKLDPIPAVGVTRTYLKLAWDELLKPNRDFDKFVNANGSISYGGVSRGIDCNNLIYPITSLRTSADSLVFKWRQSSPTSTYTFIIYDTRAKEVVHRTVKDTQCTVDLLHVLPSPGNYYWIIESEDGDCEDDDPMQFVLLTKEDEQQLIMEIISGDDSGDMAVHLQVIDKLERNRLIPAAMKYYEALVHDNSNNNLLLKSYVLFLLNYGFRKEAGSIWTGIKK